MQNSIRVFALTVLFCLSAFADVKDASAIRKGRCIPVCKVMNDAFVALAAAANTNLDAENLVSGDTVVFNSPVGPFHSAIIRKFDPPVSFLDHNFVAGGQIETMAATSLVVNATFDQCKSELLKVKDAFGKFEIDVVPLGCDRICEYGFATQRPTWGGWNICVSVRRLKDSTFEYGMTVFRKRPAPSSSNSNPLVDVDI